MTSWRWSSARAECRAGPARSERRRSRCSPLFRNRCSSSRPRSLRGRSAGSSSRSKGRFRRRLAPRRIFELADGFELDVVVLHVHDEASIPLFNDQRQHETRDWAREFVARYCPWGVGDVRLETRVGRRDEEILRAAEEFEADLIALGWAQELAPGRAPVVRAVLERGHVPVLLVPVIAATREAAVPKEEQWSSWPSLRV